MSSCSDTSIPIYIDDAGQMRPGRDDVASGFVGSSGYGIAERPHIGGTRQCWSKTGCKMLDGSKFLADDGTCRLCGGVVSKQKTAKGKAKR